MLTQAEAESLIAMEKRLEESGVIHLPHPGEQKSWKASSVDGREQFLMDVNRGRIRLAKCTYQERYRGTEILIRLDLVGPPHRNPDGEVGTPGVMLAEQAIWNMERDTIRITRAAGDTPE